MEIIHFGKNRTDFLIESLQSHARIVGVRFILSLIGNRLLGYSGDPATERAPQSLEFGSHYVETLHRRQLALSAAAALRQHDT